MEPFATNLRQRAAQLGISNAEAARRAGLSERRYGNYVSGQREPDLATLVKIAGVLATSVNNLLSAPTETLVSTQKDLLHERVIAGMRVLDRDDLERVAIMVEALVTARRDSAT
ncbi:helix-turn-helix domain-containing protein [Rhizobium sp. SL42]|uniref:helix-turn-helix domain-containing protein n=1 Tax=Rhizobium sp. SL42 TaxID=2806346 RepID=UPI001F4876B1|nr:helix-turn-helix transcriptional regulator [Rhizobium sp. SL42]UJW77649.1 helix-turn-helix transcriptional regulator [Rhizobium sp. SL42]